MCLLESKTHQALSNVTQLWPILVDDKPCHTCTTNQLPETKDPPSYREEHTHWHSNGCNAKRSLLTKQTTQCQAIMGFHRGRRGKGKGETQGICGGRGDQTGSDVLYQLWDLGAVILPLVLSCSVSSFFLSCTGQQTECNDLLHAFSLSQGFRCLTL